MWPDWADNSEYYDEGDEVDEAYETPGEIVSESLSSQLESAQAHLAKVSALAAEAYRVEKLQMLEQKLDELRRLSHHENEGDPGDDDDCDGRVRAAGRLVAEAKALAIDIELGCS